MINQTINPGKRALSQLQNPELLVCECYVGGEWVVGDSLKEVIDPGTLQPVFYTAQCGMDVVNICIDKAEQSRSDWQSRLPVDRGLILRKWAELIRKNANDLAIIISVEQGKPLFEAKGEVEYGASFLDWFAAEGERALGQSVPSHKPNMFTTNYAQPVGISLAITPWNFPLAMITRKAGAALAAGCPMIVKPAAETPLSANALAVLAAEAGIPGGVFQVIQGDAPTLCEALLKRPEIRALSFTGSTRVGQILLEQAAGTIKRCSMELGGNAPFIVFEDADLKQAVQACMAAKFATSGQDCLAANRVYVHDSLHDEFVTLLSHEIKNLKVGYGLDPDTDIGPMTVAGTPEKCAEYVRDAVHAGATIVEGKILQSNTGYFVTPLLLTGITDDMDISRQEIFAPIVSVLRFNEVDEVIQRANDTEMGLAAYIFTASMNTALWASQSLEYGMVAVNAASFTGPPLPFGGWKQSGLGLEGSTLGIYEYLENKNVSFGGLQAHPVIPALVAKDLEIAR